MTRAKTLKLVIRARAAKTGERYTTARRHVLAGRIQPAIAAGVRPTNAPAAVTPTPSKTTKGGMSDASALKRTGHDLAHWFAVLDTFGAVEKGHTAAARHLHRDHGVDGWYAQGITVAYERERGVRGVNQRRDGVWEVSVSKTVAASTPDVVKAFTDARTRRNWIGGANPGLAASIAKGLAGRLSKGWIVRPDGIGRFRYKWGDTIVQLYAYPKSAGKIALTVQHTKLADAKAVETYRSQWKTALGLLADHFAA